MNMVDGEPGEVSEVEEGVATKHNKKVDEEYAKRKIEGYKRGSANVPQEGENPMKLPEEAMGKSAAQFESDPTAAFPGRSTDKSS